jgi:D-tyrosyl-tRNA(Tyr) deacylase
VIVIMKINKSNEDDNHDGKNNDDDEYQNQNEQQEDCDENNEEKEEVHEPLSRGDINNDRSNLGVHQQGDEDCTNEPEWSIGLFVSSLHDEEENDG